MLKLAADLGPVLVDLLSMIDTLQKKLIQKKNLVAENGHVVHVRFGSTDINDGKNDDDEDDDDENDDDDNSNDDADDDHRRQRP